MTIEEMINHLKSIQELYPEDSTAHKALEMAIEKLSPGTKGIIEKLEELKNDAINENCPFEYHSSDCKEEYSCASCYIKKAINIAKDNFKN